MKEATRVRWKTAGWALFFPVSILVVIPFGLKVLFRKPWGIGWHPGSLAAPFPFLLGLFLIFRSVDLLNRKGLGTPLPTDPPKVFVAEGPYRHLRNPLMAVVFLVLFSEALFFRSKILFLYLAALFAAGNVWLIFFEEPDLARRFGKAFTDYKKEVPRWLPRSRE